MSYEDESEELLATHGQPTDESIVEIAEPSLSEKSKAAKVLQEHIKSFNRFHTHCKYFGTTPQSTLLPTNKMLEEVPEILDLIDQLASENAIISPVVSHITTKSNLSSICAQGALFGAEALQRRKISFNENCLGEGDIKSGDGNVICFGDKLIDPRALGKTREDSITLKKETLHIKIDLSKVNPPKGKYNAFFKVTDLGVSNCCQVKTTSWFSIDFLKSTKLPGYCITFQINNTKKSVILENENLLFYGDHYQINKFCLLSLFKFVEMTGDKDFIDSFYSELKNSSPEEITKILKLYGQHLTLFSEYNFNHSLDCTPGLFKEVYDVSSGICYPLGKLELNDYQAQITAITKGNFAQVPSEQKQLSCYTFNEKGEITHILSRKTRYNKINLTDVDYTSWDPNAFTSSNFTNFFELGQTLPELATGNSDNYENKLGKRNYSDGVFLWAGIPEKIKNEVNRAELLELNNAETDARNGQNWPPFYKKRDALIKKMLENQ